MSSIHFQTEPSCHLWVLVASKAPVAVIVRRGPTNHVQLILWHTDTDTFKPGQWLKGRVDGQAADISADGKLFIYGARKVTSRSLREGGAGRVGELWTVISRPPYFTALALWAHPGFCRGGGCFVRDGVMLAESQHASRQFGTALPKRWRVTYNPSMQNHLPYGSSAWQEAATPRRQGEWVRSWRLQAPGPSGFTLLRAESVTFGAKTASEYALEDSRQSVEPMSLGVAGWAGFLGDGRLAKSEGGKLYVCSPSHGVPLIWEALADFSVARFSPVMAPAWARRWPAGG